MRLGMLSLTQSVLGDLTLLGVHGIPALVNESLSMQPIQCLLVLPMPVHLSAEQLVFLAKLLVLLEERVTVGVQQVLLVLDLLHLLARALLL